MMGGHHAVSGAAAWVAVIAPAAVLTTPAVAVPLTFGLASAGWTTVLPLTLVAAGSAILADVDHHSATIAHSVPLVGPWIARTVEVASGGHRHGTHSLLALAITTAATWVLSAFLVVGGFRLGIFIAATCVSCFAVKSIKAVWFVRSWLVAWLLGAIAGWWIATTAPSPVGFAAAVAVGYATHLLGDALTVGGVPFLWPWVPKPTEAWQRIPVLNRCWQSNGYIGAPVLGLTGSIREWALAGVLTVYTLAVVGIGLSAISPNVGTYFTSLWDLVMKGTQQL